jgi:hypothetical protein
MYIPPRDATRLFCAPTPEAVRHRMAEWETGECRSLPLLRVRVTKRTRGIGMSWVGMDWIRLGWIGLLLGGADAV